jgi:hypothetical protein
LKWLGMRRPRGTAPAKFLAMPEKRSNESESVRDELKDLAARSQKLRGQAEKHAEQTAFIVDKIAAIQRRLIEAEAEKAKKKH